MNISDGEPAHEDSVAGSCATRQPEDLSSGGSSMEIPLDDAAESGAALEPKKKKKSVAGVWRYPNKYPYEHFAQLDNSKMRCLLCPRTRDPLAFNGHRSLTQHLKGVHEKE